jgi:hypothetical protein
MMWHIQPILLADLVSFAKMRAEALAASGAMTRQETTR